MLEDLLTEVPQVMFPVRGIVSMTVHVPCVRDLLLLQESLGFLADSQQLIFAAAGQPDEVILSSSRGGVRDQLFGWSGVGCG